MREIFIAQLNKFSVPYSIEGDNIVVRPLKLFASTTIDFIPDNVSIISDEPILLLGCGKVGNNVRLISKKAVGLSISHIDINLHVECRSFCFESIEFVSPEFIKKYSIPVIENVDEKIIEEIYKGRNNFNFPEWIMRVSGDDGEKLKEKFGEYGSVDLIYCASSPGRIWFKYGSGFYSDDDIDDIRKRIERNKNYSVQL